MMKGAAITSTLCKRSLRPALTAGALELDFMLRMCEGAKTHQKKGVKGAVLGTDFTGDAWGDEASRESRIDTHMST